MWGDRAVRSGHVGPLQVGLTREKKIEGKCV